MSDQHRAASPFLPRVGRLRGRPLSHEWDELRRRASSRAASLGSPRGPPSAQLVRFVPRGDASRACRSVPFLGGHVQGFAGKRGSRCRSPGAVLQRPARAERPLAPAPWVNDHLDFMVAFIPRLFSVSFSPHSPCAHLSPCSCHPFPSLVPHHTSWHRRLFRVKAFGCFPGAPCRLSPLRLRGHHGRGPPGRAVPCSLPPSPQPHGRSLFPLAA